MLLKLKILGVILRNKLLISTCILAQAIIAQGAFVNDANAFGFGKPKKASTTPLRAGMTPQVQMPGENQETAVQSALEADKETLKQLGPPATKQQREEAKKADLITQARFWVVEFSKNQKDEEVATEAANALERIGSYDKAIETAAMGIQSFENNGKLWKVLGSSLLKSNKFEEAAQALTKAKTLMNNDAETRNYLGIAFDNLGNFDQAYKSYNEARTLAPNNPNFASNLGFSLMMAGKFNEAEAVLRQAVNMQGAPIQARQNLALAIGIQGRLAESEKVAQSDLPTDIAQQNIKYLREMLDGSQRWKQEPKSK